MKSSVTGLNRDRSWVESRPRRFFLNPLLGSRECRVKFRPHDRPSWYSSSSFMVLTSKRLRNCIIGLIRDGAERMGLQGPRAHLAVHTAPRRAGAAPIRMGCTSFSVASRPQRLYELLGTG